MRAKRLEELSKPENMKATAVKQLSTLQEICALWLKTKKPDVKESTYTRYVRAVDKYILPAFEIRQLIKIDKTVIYAAFDMLKTHLSDKTVSDIRCIFIVNAKNDFNFPNQQCSAFWINNHPKSKY